MNEKLKELLDIEMKFNKDVNRNNGEDEINACIIAIYEILDFLEKKEYYK